MPIPAVYRPARLTVNTAATSRDLTLLATLKAELNVSTTTNDALYSGYITQASALITAYCWREFVRENVTESFRLNEPRSGLVLQRVPIVAAGFAVVQDGSAVDPSTYDIDLDVGILDRIDAPWAGGASQYALAGTTNLAFGRSTLIAVTYTAGYVCPGQAAGLGLPVTLPSQVERACLIITKALIDSPFPADAIRMRAGDTEIQRAAATMIDADTKWMLRPYTVNPVV